MLFVTSDLNGDASIFAVGSKSSDRRNLLNMYHSANDIVAAYRIYDEWKKNRMEKNFSHLNTKSLETFKSKLQELGTR